MTRQLIERKNAKRFKIGEKTILPILNLPNAI